MGEAMIKCPKTGQYVKTGIAMDRKSFETVEMSGNSTHCPACGDTHVWSKKDVHWIEPLAGPRND
jgi:PHP family Zn ribbon phosphoesterase